MLILFQLSVMQVCITESSVVLNGRVGKPSLKWNRGINLSLFFMVHSGGSFHFFWNAFEIILLLGNNVRNNKRWSLDSCVYVCYIRNMMYHFFLSPVQIKGSLYWLKQEMFMELLQRTMYAHSLTSYSILALLRRFPNIMLRKLGNSSYLNAVLLLYC